MGALSGHGPDGSRTEQLGSARFGTQFHHTLPEDDFDCQPYIVAGGRFLIAADARIDNRDELAAALGNLGTELAAISDTDLLARCWERWKLNLFDRLLGDVAMAIWDEADRELTFVRTPLSSRPIFFHQADGFVSFASLPSALFPLGAVRRSPNLDEFAKLLAGGLFQASIESFFDGIQSVPQGHAIVFKAGRWRQTCLWLPGEHRLNISVPEAGELLRGELDRAVKAQARRRSGPLACMLSSGRDSSAVMASAVQADPSAVIALTAAPRSNVDGIATPWIGDESGMASQSAAALGAAHRICRSENCNLVELLDRVSATHFQPFNNPVNLPWLAQLHQSARQSDASVMTTGATGNFTVSLGGASFLPDAWRELGPAPWISLATGLHGRGALSWSQIAGHSFGSLLPRRFHSWLRLISGRGPGVKLDLPLLRQPIRSRAEEFRKARFTDLRARPSRRKQYAELVQLIEPANKYSLACWGIDVRDPTADRRLAEICLSMPVEAYVGTEHDRPAYALAFRNRLPAEVIAGVHRGAQAADWYATIQPSQILAGFQRYYRNPIVADIFDDRAIEQMIERWPVSAAEADENYDEYCNQLLGGLAVASFINVHFPV